MTEHNKFHQNKTSLLKWVTVGKHLYIRIYLRTFNYDLRPGSLTTGSVLHKLDFINVI